VQPTHTRERLLSNEFTGGEQSDRGFLAVGPKRLRVCAARSKIEDGVSRASLPKKKTCFGCKWTTFRPTPASSRKVARSKVMILNPRHLNGPSRMRSSREQFGREFDRFRLEEAGIANWLSRMRTILLHCNSEGILCPGFLRQRRMTLIPWKLSASAGIVSVSNDLHESTKHRNRPAVSNAFMWPVRSRPRLQFSL